jgi:hypothetical protein
LFAHFGGEGALDLQPKLISLRHEPVRQPHGEHHETAFLPGGHGSKFAYCREILCERLAVRFGADLD